MRLAIFLLLTAFSTATAVSTQQPLQFITALAAAAHATKSTGDECARFREGVISVSYPKKPTAKAVFDVGGTYRLSTEEKAAEDEMNQAAKLYGLDNMINWSRTGKVRLALFLKENELFVMTIQKADGPGSLLCIAANHAR